MQAGVVDDDLHGACRGELLAGRARGDAVGHVEGHRFGTAAGGDDGGDGRVGRIAAAVRMDDHVRAVAPEPLGDGPAEAAAAARHEGAASGCRNGRGVGHGEGDRVGDAADADDAAGIVDHAMSRTTASRPDAISTPPCETLKA